MIAEDLYDHEFVTRYTTGFDELAQAARAWTPEWAESMCDVPAAEIVATARDLAAAAPAAANGAYLPKTSPRAVKKPARPPAISHTALRTYGTVRPRLCGPALLKLLFPPLSFPPFPALCLFCATIIRSLARRKTRNRQAGFRIVL